jgi:hypothetical protein
MHMAVTGGCYCGQVRYSIEGETTFHGQCHCRECQYFSGGNPNLFIGVSAENYSYTQGEAKDFFRDDIEGPAHREFCPNCGTHLATRIANGTMVVKVGALDDPSVFKSQFAIQMADAQTYHSVPEGVPCFDRWMD